MPTTQLSPLPVQRFFDNNNNPLVGGQLYTYIAGTSTLQATYTDSTGGTPNTNPVVLNSRGEANVWMTVGQSYKFVLQDASSNIIWTVDNISGPATSGRLLNIQTFTTTGTYTPTSGTSKVVVEIWGGGGGGGGGASTGAGQLSLGGGGGAGGYAQSLISSAFSGVTVTIGGGGANGGVGTAGGTGGTTSFGALCQATGGIGGSSAAANANPFTTGGNGGLGSSGSLVNLAGQAGSSAFGTFSITYAASGAGGTGPKGSAGPSTIVATASGNAAGASGTGYGVGGAGAATGASQGGAAGGVGAQGLCLVYEYA